MNRLLFSLLLTWSLPSFAINIDSLLHSVENQEERHQVKLLNEALKEASYGDSSEFHTLAEAINDLNLSAASEHELSLIKKYREARWWKNNDQIAEAILLLTDLEHEIEDDAYAYIKARVQILLSEIYSDLGSVHQAIAYSKKALESAHKAGDEAFVMVVYNVMGEDYRIISDYEKAISYYDLSLRIAQSLNDSLYISRVSNNKGIALSQLERYDDADEILYKGLIIAESIGHKYSQAILLTNLGFNAKNRGLFKEALEYYNRSLALKLEFGNEGSIAYTLNDIGETYFFMGDLRSSISHSKRALEKAVKADALYYVKDINNTLAHTYEKMGKMDSAYLYVRAYDKVRNEILSSDNLQEIARLERIYELKEKQLENELLLSENKSAKAQLSQHRWLLIFSTFGVIALLIIGVLLWQLSSTRKRLLTRLKIRNRALDQSNVRLSHLLNEQEALFNIVTHDLKGPLINAQRLLEMEEEADASEKSQLRGMLKRSVNSSLDFITEFNTLHELEKTAQLPTHETFDLTELIGQLIEHFQSQLRNKNLTVHFNKEQSVFVDGLRSYARHIFYNLLSNAVKYSPENGSIFITITQSENTRVSFENQGKGINAEETERIFERFYRGTSSEGHSHSNGLGLSLVKLLLDKQGGEIKVKSTPGKKTEFVVYLP